MSSMVMDGIARSRSTDPTTSVDAGRQANLKGSQAAVLGTIRLGKRGWTQFELEENHKEFSPSRVRSAVSELVELGLVVPTDRLRETPHGRQARIYKSVA